VDSWKEESEGNLWDWAMHFRRGRVEFLRRKGRLFGIIKQGLRDLLK